MQDNSVVITGIGLLSSLGEGLEAHWQAVAKPEAPNLDTENFAPYVVHKLGKVDWKQQIPRRSDLRQMDIWQKIGTYTAGLALEDAGLKSDEEVTSKMDMIIAAGGGERDINVDTQILAKGRETQDDKERGEMLNQMLLTELRPTLFLAQLSNLLAGNISIVHKITGSSRTFMGEEGSGLAALETAYSRIQSGQSTHMLVGASYNAEHYDMLLGQELNSYLKADGYAPIWSRHNEKEKNSSARTGLITGTAGVFFVIESGAHAKARGAKAYAKIDSVLTDQINRQKKSVKDKLVHMLETLRQNNNQTNFAVSGASGVNQITQQEEKALQEAGLSYRALSSLFGHLREAQFPFAVALAAIAIQKGQAFGSFEPGEKAISAPLSSALATIAGIDRAEGMALLSKV